MQFLLRRGNGKHYCIYIPLRPGLHTRLFGNNGQKSMSNFPVIIYMCYKVFALVTQATIRKSSRAIAFDFENLQMTRGLYGLSATLLQMVWVSTLSKTNVRF